MWTAGRSTNSSMFPEPLPFPQAAVTTDGVQVQLMLSKAMVKMSLHSRAGHIRWSCVGNGDCVGLCTIRHIGRLNRRICSNCQVGFGWGNEKRIRIR